MMEIEAKQGRKLKFKEVGMLLKIIKEIDIRWCKQQANDTLKKFTAEENKIKIEKEKAVKNIKDEELKKEKIKELDLLLESTTKNATIEVAIDVIAHLLDNYAYAEETIFKFFAAYKGIEEKEAQEQDIDWVIDTAMELYRNGLPSVLTNILSAEDIKKKITQITK